MLLKAICGNGSKRYKRKCRREINKSKRANDLTFELLTKRRTKEGEEKSISLPGAMPSKDICILSRVSVYFMGGDETMGAGLSVCCRPEKKTALAGRPCRAPGEVSIRSTRANGPGGGGRDTRRQKKAAMSLAPER